MPFTEINDRPVLADLLSGLAESVDAKLPHAADDKQSKASLPSLGAGRVDLLSALPPDVREEV